MQALLLDKGWVNHPVTKMWRGYEWELLLYCDAMQRERTKRGRPIHTSMLNVERLYFRYRDAEEPVRPRWLGAYNFHQSHQSNLVAKDFDYYRPQFPDVVLGLPYIYPI